MKIKSIYILAALIVANANAQTTSFVAGWDFDGVGTTLTSMTSNWGDLSGSATLTWTHDVATGPPTFSAAEFGISTGFNSAVVGDTFAFVDPNTGFDQFSDPGDNGEFGFESLSAGDSFTFNFDGSGYKDLSMSYALDAAGDGTWVLTEVDLSAFDGNPNASFVLSTADGARYDNFAITGNPADAANGSLFILENPASSLLATDWYRTPMGDLYTGAAPWIWSNDYGWHFSPESNTGELAYVYIQSAPFQGWVYVDQNSAVAQGFWGYAFNASSPALNGWFWFLNTASTSNTSEYYIWDNEGQQTLTFEDAAQVNE